MYQALNQQQHKPRVAGFFPLLCTFLATLILSINVLAAEEATAANATEDVDSANIESPDTETQTNNTDQDNTAAEESNDDLFIPSVQISEDLSVSFPVNI